MERKLIAVILNCIMEDLHEYENQLFIHKLFKALNVEVKRKFPQDLFHRSFKAYIYWKFYKATLETDRVVDNDKPDTEVISATIYALRRINLPELNKLVADHAIMAELPDKEAEGEAPAWARILSKHELSTVIEAIDGEIKKAIEECPFVRPCGE